MNDDATRAAEDYDAMGPAYADDVRTHPINAAYERPTMLAMAGDVRRRRVLDVGCAAGALSALLVERGAEVVGIDVSERLVEIARRDLGGRAEFHVADVGRPMPFLADESFDLVTASLVLHYLRDWAVPGSSSASSAPAARSSSPRTTRPWTSRSAIRLRRTST